MRLKGKIMLRNFITVAICCALPLAAAVGADSKPAPAAAKFDSGTVSGLGARNIGSAQMSGRIAALAARHEEDGRTTLFVGAASGGVWKSLDGGTTFKPVFDKQSVQSIGAIAVDPNHHDTIWVGTGESWTRNSTSVGDGIYKSSDGGESWMNVGLANSERTEYVSPCSSRTAVTRREVNVAPRMWLAIHKAM